MSTTKEIHLTIRQWDGYHWIAWSVRERKLRQKFFFEIANMIPWNRHHFKKWKKLNFSLWFIYLPVDELKYKLKKQFYRATKKNEEELSVTVKRIKRPLHLALFVKESHSFFRSFVVWFDFIIFLFESFIWTKWNGIHDGSLYIYKNGKFNRQGEWRAKMCTNLMYKKAIQRTHIEEMIFFFFVLGHHYFIQFYCVHFSCILIPSTS